MKDLFHEDLGQFYAFRPAGLKGEPGPCDLYNVLYALIK